jgi:hypothetical protein
MNPPLGDNAHMRHRGTHAQRYCRSLTKLGERGGCPHRRRGRMTHGRDREGLARGRSVPSTASVPVELRGVQTLHRARIYNSKMRHLQSQRTGL